MKKLTKAQSEFIEKIGAIIRDACIKHGYLYPSAIIAQAILESNYGKSELSKTYHNYFGMKAGGSWHGKSVNMKTKEEYTPGTQTEIRDNFRVYDNMIDGVEGYFDFISLKRYHNLKTAGSSEDYIRLIKVDGYATSTKYVENLIRLVEDLELKRFDNFLNIDVTPHVVDDKVVDDVIAGKYGVGARRKLLLRRAGYNYTEVQQAVNKRLRGV